MKRSVILIAGFLIALTPPALAQDGSFVFQQTPQPVSALQFQDESGAPHSLKEFRGKTILLNIWATWCLPCRKEMPTLDKLQAELGGDKFQVVALSIDVAGPNAVRKFFAEFNIRNLALYIDQTNRSAADLGVVGLPTTLLINENGQELGRLVGPAEWDSPEMRDLLQKYIGARSGSRSGIDPVATAIRVRGRAVRSDVPSALMLETSCKMEM